MTLLSDIRAECERLEAAKRRAGIVTSRMVADALACLPAPAKGMLSEYHFKRVSDALNHALDDQAGTNHGDIIDPKSRQANDP